LSLRRLVQLVFTGLAVLHVTQIVLSFIALVCFLVVVEIHFVYLLICAELILRRVSWLVGLSGHLHCSLPEFVVQSLVHQILALKPNQLVVVTVHDKCLDVEVFKSIIVAEHDELLDVTKLI